ncbi:MAG: glycosyltransferase family 4 protein [Rhodobacteraceae bacterium]|nr:glycosyltransferase family 4 protein [Paracoccaceae bacterium]
MKQRILHLIDDKNPGGVMRFLDFIKHSKTMRAEADHSERFIKRGAFSAPKLKADLIVSHLTVSWRSLPFFLALRAMNPVTPIVHFEHTYTLGFFTNYVTAHRRFKSLLRTSYALFDHVVAVSDAQARWLRGNTLVPARKLSVIKPCVDLSAFLSLRPRFQKPIKSVGAIGRLNAIKGFDILISAFKSTNLKTIDLHIYGDGPERPALELLAGNASNIHFHGHVNDPAVIMKNLDAVLMPSHFEPYGLVALEARAAGRPLLVSGVDGLQDHVDNGAGKVCNQSPEAWGHALQNLIKTPDYGQVLQSRNIAAGAQGRFYQNWQSLISAMAKI